MLFGGKVYIIPKSDTLNGSQKWKDTMKICQDYNGISQQYHQRNNSESSFAAYKKMLGWGQRRDDRVDSALFCTGLWHNLFNLNR